MNFQFFDLATVAATPWKNGGGLTQELVCVPAGAGLGAFDWRISVAQVTADGPFSSFEGIDRVILLLNGKGMTLEGRDHQHALAQPLLPYAFAGEVAMGCSLIDGPTTDLNVMVRRHAFTAEVSVVTHAAELPLTPDGMLFVVDGNWQLPTFPASSLNGPSVAEPLRLSAGQGIWWHEADQLSRAGLQAHGQPFPHTPNPMWTLAPLQAGHLVLVQIHKRPGLLP
jgi:environmental stress-induced protein Ves